MKNNPSATVTVACDKCDYVRIYSLDAYEKLGPPHCPFDYRLMLIDPVLTEGDQTESWNNKLILFAVFLTGMYIAITAFYFIATAHGHSIHCLSPWSLCV